MTDDNILEIRNVTKKFPGVTALSNISFNVKRGEIHGLCGENGAGKSTLMKILSGVHPSDSYEGEVIFDNEQLNFQSTAIKEAIERGIAIVYQELVLVPEMTVGENIFLGREPINSKGAINWHKLYSETDKILKRYNLKIPFAAKISSLGVGKQQLVVIAKALSENAKILILDEPTSALTESEVDVLMEILERLRNEGMTCIYITHKLDEFFRITDTMTIMRDGTLVDTVRTKDLNHEKIIAMMVGREMTERYPAREATPGDVVLEARGITVPDPVLPHKNCVDNVSFSVRRGEILGVAGLMGAGRTELVTTLFGEYGKNFEGTISIDGETVGIHSASSAMNAGISLVPEDRKLHGLVLMQSILKNISLPNMNKFAERFSINQNKEFYECNETAKKLSVKCHSIHVPVNTLSGGNQQKVVIAKCIMTAPKVLILDEPTRGIDVGAKYEIYKLMNTLTAQGVAIIMVSSELPEVLGMSDRILVMHEGKCTGIIPNDENATQERIMTLATGVEVLHS
ncbi:MAG: ATP-binding cassette domain-containing protein [Deltaproteobacteria bacterium]|nr:ATP-binding cassette domain-containing protein [Deltaproteobacteria bacterium]